MTNLGMKRLSHLSNKCSAAQKTCGVTVDMTSSTAGVMRWSIAVSLEGHTIGFYTFDATEFLFADMMLDDLSRIIENQLTILGAFDVHSVDA